MTMYPHYTNKSNIPPEQISYKQISDREIYKDNDGVSSKHKSDNGGVFSE